MAQKMEMEPWSAFCQVYERFFTQSRRQRYRVPNTATCLA
ncbi:hypothetical protein CCACVL1_28495, partial [Corchorus capsularis]